MATVNSAVREIALSRAIKILNSVGVDYAVRSLDGEFVIQGDIQIAAPRKRKKRSASKLPHGTLKNHIEKFGFSSLNIGDVCTLSADGIDTDLDTLRSAACARANLMWGKQSVITSIDKKHGFIEVLRLI